MAQKYHLRNSNLKSHLVISSLTQKKNSNYIQKLRSKPTIYKTVFQQMDYGNSFKVMPRMSIVVFSETIQSKFIVM